MCIYIIITFSCKWCWWLNPHQRLSYYKKKKKKISALCCIAGKCMTYYNDAAYSYMEFPTCFSL